MGRDSGLGMWQEKDGSWRTRVDGKKVRVHREELQRQLGRDLNESEYIIHRDGDKSNNSISNLEMVNKGEPIRRRNINLRGSGWVMTSCVCCEKIALVRKYYYDKVIKKKFKCYNCKPSYYNCKSIN